MRQRTRLAAMALGAACTVAALGGQSADMKKDTGIAVDPAPSHVVVARAPGRYGGWPANHGIWAWGNEILVGFSWGHMRGGGAESGHPIDRQQPEEHMLARSLDGGATWTHEKAAGLIPPP
ncbi:MAG: hypothetical protein M3545_18680, partial [Acidobacteriota bacterium]|nr:hypothetical protein [Acidobacteriota bacterium]